ncbi:hypothetical protein [Mycoplasmopsis cynos]|uniref:hypothetical protein n=1 Tax=Mycoplasmopsis cynos TaxID=171284 RepID=UPI002209122F|nr:hypothetical protein [Mycoplasmopsis cynos]UWV76944.1 hypothetical protein NW070_03900 [Mycoplasmopsis cynos]
MLNYEQENFKNKLIAGCDEVGRGCVAGPLVAACVIFPIDYKNDFINDSKKLTSKKRNELFEQIKKDALDYCIIERSVEEINNSNPKKESQIAMELCIKSLKVTWTCSDWFWKNFNKYWPNKPNQRRWKIYKYSSCINFS